MNKRYRILKMAQQPMTIFDAYKLFIAAFCDYTIK